MGVEKYKTCAKCGTDNPESAAKCNSCGEKLDNGLFRIRYHKRWECPKCGTLNMEENKKCMCGYKRGWFS